MAEQIPAATDDLERILAPLIDVFPQGATADRVRIYANLLRPEKFQPADVREGVNRLIHVWERTTFPPFAKLLACCNDARELRLRVERREAEEREAVAVKHHIPPEVWEKAIEENRALRMKVMPKREPDIRTDREAKRKHLGIVPLTKDEIEMIERNKRERERARQAEARTKPANEGDEIPF